MMKYRMMKYCTHWREGGMMKYCMHWREGGM